MMAWRPSVSVIVPAYNAEGTIEACVDSLLELRYPRDRLELCVVDNASGDGTVRALAPYRDRVVVVSERRRGAGAARNAGLRRTSGEVVAFTDADCVVDRWWLARLLVPLRDPAVGIAGGEILALPPADPVQRFGETIHDHRAAIDEYTPPYVITMSWAARLDVMREVGGFDEEFLRGQDVELSYRIIQAGYALAFAPGSVVYHHNEGDLRGLFHEGFTHGFHGVRVTKRHAAFLRGFGHGRATLRPYRRIGEGLVTWARGQADDRGRCETAFNAGKRVGKMLGSTRFRHLDV